MILSATDAAEQLAAARKLFLVLFENETILAEIYKPHKVDLQQPHDQDEVYVILSGSGRFVLENEVRDCKTGDLIFVKAGQAHRFQDFTDDFATWVIFVKHKQGS
jgi:mannose-6-phosphate isomerase-like protein (cupin superfamily)